MEIPTSIWYIVYELARIDTNIKDSIYKYRAPLQAGEPTKYRSFFQMPRYLF